jgi:hypothetical protein
MVKSTSKKKCQCQKQNTRKKRSPSKKKCQCQKRNTRKKRSNKKRSSKKKYCCNNECKQSTPHTYANQHITSVKKDDKLCDIIQSISRIDLKKDWESISPSTLSASTVINSRIDLKKDWESISPSTLSASTVINSPHGILQSVLNLYPHDHNVSRIVIPGDDNLTLLEQKNVPFGVPSPVTSILVDPPKNEALPEPSSLKLECIICFDADAQIAFNPCGHLNVCMYCAPSLTQCPICRTEILSKLRVFL